MPQPYMGKILRVSLTSGAIQEEELPEEVTRAFIGGVGISSKYLYDEVPAGIDPLGPQNKLIFMTGPLTGTNSASAARYSVVAKSPLTQIWGHSNSGGTFGPALKHSGYDGIIFEGVSEKPVYLSVSPFHTELCDASHLWGKTVPETEDILQRDTRERLTIASIGPAGEKLVLYAAIMNNKHRAAGRGGLGAVMGSKNLKAIACSGREPIELFDQPQFTSIAKKQLDLIDESLLKVGFDTFGTSMVSDMVNVRGGYPSYNWQSGEFEEIEEVNAQAIVDKVLVKGTSCFACPITCGRETEIRNGKWKGKKGEGPEYETTNTLGALCGISDLNDITMANYLCNENGLDTISTGASIAFAMECFEKGILTTEDTGGISLKFGNADTVIKLVEMIAKRDGFGNTLADGTRRMAERLGSGSEYFAIHVKGMELPAYDPRAAKIAGLGYVTATRGGDHMTGYVQGPTFIDLPFLIVDNSTIRNPLEANPKEAQVLVDMENALTMLDALGGCKFMGVLITAGELVELINNATGWTMSVSDFRKSGERIYNLVRMYNVREGASRADDILPPRLTEDPLPDGAAKGMVIESYSLEAMKDAYYTIRGWDIETGIPNTDKLTELTLDNII